MAVSYSVSLTLGYKDSDFTRKYVFDDVEAGSLSSVKANVMEYNDNLPEADKMIFIADDFDDSDQTAVVGTLKGIVSAQYAVTTTTKIPLN